MSFEPTHKITLSAFKGTPKEEILVYLVDGAAYTVEEFEAGAPADWEIDDNGGLSFQGSPRPGVGRVEICEVGQ